MIRAVSCSLLSAAALCQEPQPIRLELVAGGLELQAAWEPLTDTVYGFDRSQPLVRDLAVAKQRQRHDASAFRVFLPAGPVAVGDVWRVDVRAALPLLRQLHPGATHAMHHGFAVAAPGGFGCLRAVDEAHAEIRLRLHADFLIDGDGTRGRSSWFTPAQFCGRLVVDRQSGAPVAFELAVPQQRANVDVNIATERGGMADIGRVPRLGLRGGAFPALADGATAIAERDADARLAERFYPCAAIEWHDLAAARAEARATGKPLHVIALFGSLLDESC